jgi:DnaK suppressor protein
MTMKSTLPPPTIGDLRVRLECERDRLKEQIADLRAAESVNQPQESVAWGKEVTDQADQGMDQAEWDRLHIEELALADRLAEVEHALAKIPLGAYGVCEACGQPIPEARLQEMPAARFDLEHEVAFENRIHAQEQLPEPGF